MYCAMRMKGGQEALLFEVTGTARKPEGSEAETPGKPERHEIQSN
jgi:hypothetical protein